MISGKSASPQEIALLTDQTFSSVVLESMSKVTAADRTVCSSHAGSVATTSNSNEFDRSSTCASLLASRVRMRYPGIKVVYMSGYTESALVQDGMLERNTILLQKPFTVKKLLEVVQQLNSAVRS